MDEGMIKLISRDGDEIEVPSNIAYMSQLVKDTLSGEDEDEEDSNEGMPLPNVSGAVLKKVVEFCTHYQEDPMTPISTPFKSNKLEEIVQQWYADYTKVDRHVLFDLVAAANFMDIRPLLDLTCLAVSILIKGKSADELRQMFNINSQFSPEEEAQAQRENEFARNPTLNADL